MYQDYKDLRSAFRAHAVKYLIMKRLRRYLSLAAPLHKGIPLFIKADAANAQATHDALAQFGAPLESIRPGDFADRITFSHLGRDLRRFDILPEIPGLDFDGAGERQNVNRGYR